MNYSIDYIAKLITFFGIVIITVFSTIVYSEYKENRVIELRSIKQDVELEILRTETDYLYESKRESVNALILDVENSNKSLQNKKLNQDSIFLERVDLIDKLLAKRKEYSYLDSIVLPSIRDKINTMVTTSKMDKKLKENYISDRNICLSFILLGILISGFGIRLWHKNEIFQHQIALRQNLDKPTISLSCQSCGQKFNSMILYGTEADGNKSYHFCIMCYKKGNFVEPELTIGKLEQRIDRELTYLYIRRSIVLYKIRRLDRWKNNNY